MAHLLYGVSGVQHGGLEEDLFGDGGAAVYAAAAAAGLNSADESLPYSTSELNAPEYSTDEFRMFQFKVARCSKRYVHDWRACPFAHPTENARRRDPRSVKYQPIPCPDYKRGICLRGDSCTYSHGVYECWLHPAKYRTQLCKEGPNCRRPVCFFAHSVLDLRQPSHMYDPTAGGAEDVSASVAAALVQQAAAQQQQAAAVAAAAAAGAAAAAAQHRLSSDAAFQQRLSTEEMLNNLQDSRASADGNGAVPVTGSPTGSRQSSLSGSGSGRGSGGSASGSPERSGSPNTPGQPGPLDGPAQRSLEVPLASAPAGVPSDAAAAMALLTQQQQAHAAAQVQAQAAALARLSMESRGSLDAAAVTRASLDAAAAAATTQAMMQHAGNSGVPPRMSLDSLLASRQAPAGGWMPGALPPPGATAAAALAAGPTSSLPLNEQPFPSGNAPRMSNAVARKLGLAPQRTSLDARLGKLARGPGMATPPRTSIDNILAALQLQQQQQQGGSGRSSLDQQASAMLQAMGNNPQLAHMAGLNGLQPGLNGYGSAPAPAYSPVNGYGGGPAGGEAINPALLSLVAAQMQGGGPAPPAGVPAGGMHSGLGTQHGSDANMAALVDSLNTWQLGNPGAAGPTTMGHRGSMDGMTGMAGAPGMPAAQAAGAPGGPGYYDGKAMWGNGSNEALNNASGSDS